MANTAALLPPVLKDTRGLAFVAALDGSLALDPWQAAPLKLSHASDEVLWELARQFDVAGPLYQAMQTRERKERLVEMALRLQRKRGTPWAVEEVCRLLGYTDAQVIDRVKLLVYNGEARYDGEHTYDSRLTDVTTVKRYCDEIIYDGTFKYGPLKADWSDYKIRLFMASDSRTLTEFDRLQVEQLAAEWAPLRSRLLEVIARQLITTTAADPASEVTQIYRVILLDRVGNRLTVPRITKRYLDDGTALIQWRLMPWELRLAEVVSIILVTRRGVEIYKTSLREVKAARNVTLEGVWTFKTQ